MSNYEMKYPIICISGPSVEVMPDPTRFGRCTIFALRNRIYDGMVVIDSANRRYDICGARKIGYPKPFWGFRWLQRIVEVEPIVKSDPVAIPLDDVIQLICAAIDKEPFFYASATGDHEDIKRMVRSCKSLKGIMGLGLFDTVKLE